PRSAHIAGLPYAAFADPGALTAPELENFEPKPGDGGDYVAIRTANGQRYALTTTCASNVLGYAKPGTHAHGNRVAATRAFAPLAEALGLSVEDAARAVLECATAKIVPVVESLIKEYHLDPDQCLLIGEGGGAASLVPYTAERMQLVHEISRDAEVISSIGVALALVRDVVERVIPHPQPQDLIAIRQEALDAAVRLGADRQNVDVTVEVDPMTHRVRATAMGAAEMHVKDASGAIPERVARRTAADSLDASPDQLRLAAETTGLRVYQHGDGDAATTRAVDWEGTIRVRRSRARVAKATKETTSNTIAGLWQQTATHTEGGREHPPGLLLLIGRHVIDLSGVETLDQALALARSELDGHDADEPIAVIAMRTQDGKSI
ncbi:MAG TPA: hydantoinase/oxoprolinase family protein, partial [Hyphomicrobiaceae bacterium]|nr:hydantoinase/oxoprolinase family protein [Hyphomicrobiaceae bacterium]